MNWCRLENWFQSSLTYCLAAFAATWQPGISLPLFHLLYWDVYELQPTNPAYYTFNKVFITTQSSFPHPHKLSVRRSQPKISFSSVVSEKHFQKSSSTLCYHADIGVVLEGRYISLQYLHHLTSLLNYLTKYFVMQVRKPSQNKCKKLKVLVQKHTQVPFLCQVFQIFKQK